MSDSKTNTTTFRPDIDSRPAYDHGKLGSSASYVPDSKTLVVGREINLNGEIAACDKLVVEGRVEASLNNCNQIEVSAGGHFKGTAVVDDARINGTFEGSITVRNILVIQSSGNVSSNVLYGELEIERGGRLSGSVSSLDEANGDGETTPVTDFGNSKT